MGDGDNWRVGIGVLIQRLGDREKELKLGEASVYVYMMVMKGFY